MGFCSFLSLPLHTQAGKILNLLPKWLSCSMSTVNLAIVLQKFTSCTAFNFNPNPFPDVPKDEPPDQPSTLNFCPKSRKYSLVKLPVKRSHKQEKSVLLFPGNKRTKTRQKGEDVRQSLLVMIIIIIIIIITTQAIPIMYKQVCIVLSMIRDSPGKGTYNSSARAKTDAWVTKLCSGSSTGVSSNKLNLLCFSWVAVDETQPWDGFTCHKWLREGQGLWQVCRRKDKKSLTVVLYFFLLQDAPHSPSVLIGSGECSHAHCADVNGAWRTSAAGTNIPTSLLPFLRPVAGSVARLLHLLRVNLSTKHLTNFCGSHLPPCSFPAKMSAQGSFWCFDVAVSWIFN